jgi:hypothetical protein
VIRDRNQRRLITVLVVLTGCAGNAGVSPVPTVLPDPTISLIERAACEEVSFETEGLTLSSVAESAAHERLLRFVQDNPGSVFGYYVSDSPAFVVVAAPETYGDVVESLRSELRGALLDFPREVAVQPGCFTLEQLRELRAAVRDDPFVQEYFAERGWPVSTLGFAIESTTGRLALDFPGGMDYEPLKEHLIETYGVDRLKFDHLIPIQK